MRQAALSGFASRLVFSLRVEFSVVSRAPFLVCCSARMDTKKRAILVGFRNQMIADGRLRPGSVGMNCVMFDGGERKAVEELYTFGDRQANLLKMAITSDEKFMDDLTGQPLDPILCRAARKKEMDFVRDKGLWVKRSVNECWKRTGRPPVIVRWVETNKGDDVTPNI